MKIATKSPFYIILLSLIFITCFYRFINAHSEIIVTISIPKCDTHLLTRCISLLTSKTSFWTTADTIEEVIKHAPQKKFLGCHLKYSYEKAKILKKNNCNLFFIYRNPRDCAVSAVYYMQKHTNIWPAFQSLSFDDALTSIIIAINQDNYRIYMPWFNEINICVVRFEDLVGSHGGGNDQAQYEAVNHIANQLGLDYNNAQLSIIADDLFGKSGTFYKGQICSWKSHFNNAHKQLFKELAGDLLISLGYEKDDNW